MSFSSKLNQKSRFRELILKTIIWVPCSIKNKALRSFEPKFGQKKLLWRIWQKYFPTQNQHPWKPLCTKYHLKGSTFVFQGQISPTKGFLGTQCKKAIVKFRINALENTSLPSFIQSKIFSGFRTKFAQKWYFENII